MGVLVAEWMKGAGRMTRERIEDFREIVLPFVKKRLLETNYENLGKSDAEEFTRDFNEILNLAIKALEQEPILDKIRAEITAIAINGQVDEHIAFIRTGEQVKQMALDVIDKYKAESENI